MKITFEVETRIVTIDEYGYKSWQAALICNVNNHYGRHQAFEYMANHTSKNEALRLTFEAFLNNDVRMVGESSIERTDREEGYETLVLDMKWLSQEYQDLLWQLIDLKYGKDRTAKLKVAAEFGYPPTFPLR